MYFDNDLLIQAAEGRATERTPVWLMRQAGRSDPEYNRMKEAAGLPLEQLFRHPEWAAKLSLLPKRFGVDGVILFQDILTPLTPMGAHFVFAPGPRLVNPIRTPEEVAALHTYKVSAEMGFVGETIHLIHEALDGDLPVLGFAGAPATLAVFILENGSFGDQADSALSFFRNYPGQTHELLEKLTDMTIDYLKYQITHGVSAVQLFESAAYLMSPDLYDEFALPYQQRVFRALRGTVPTIHFAREWNDLMRLDAAGADIISLPSAISIREARKQLGAHRVFQGNLDNQLLARGSRESIARAARACIAEGGHRGHIFNLSHGLLRDTPFENVTYLIDLVRDTVLAH